MKGIKIAFAAIAIMIITFAVVYPGKATVLALIIGGKFVAPEAADITYQYVFGHGEDLHLDADYIKNSPVVLKNLNLIKGEVRRVALKQSEDWRLSYALNPFHIKRSGDGYIVYQYVDYGHGVNKNVKSKLNLGFTTISVYDNIVHSFDCTPFTVFFKFKY